MWQAQGNKLKDEIGSDDHGDRWLSRHWFKNTFEIIGWFWVIGGPINMVIAEPENKVDFGIWAIISIMFLITRWILNKTRFWERNIGHWISVIISICIILWILFMLVSGAIVLSRIILSS